MKKIYLHIGTAKTGSSALQAFFYKNAKLLEDNGIYYPLEYGGIPFNNFLLSGGNLGPLILEKDNHDDELVEIISSLLDKYKVILLSSEYLWDHFDYRMEIFNGLSKLNCTVEIIVYLRPQVDYIESMYRESVENLYSTYVELDDFFEAINSNRSVQSEQEDSVQRIINGVKYYQRISKLCDIFGKKHIHVKIYERSQMKHQDIYEDFLDVLGIQIDNSYIYPEGTINPTLDCSLVDIRRYINSLKGYSAAEKQDVFRDIMENITADKRREKNLNFKSSISNEKRNKIMSYFESDNSRIAIEFCDKEDGVLFCEQKPSDFIPETVTETEMLKDTIKIFSSLAFEQNRNNAQNTSFVKDLAYKVNELYNVHRIFDQKLLEIEQSNTDLKQKLLDKTNELEAIKSSTCWKLTKPLRSIVQFIGK